MVVFDCPRLSLEGENMKTRKYILLHLDVNTTGAGVFSLSLFFFSLAVVLTSVMGGAVMGSKQFIKYSLFLFNSINF